MFSPFVFHLATLKLPNLQFTLWFMYKIACVLQNKTSIHLGIWNDGFNWIHMCLFSGIMCSWNNVWCKHKMYTILIFFFAISCHLLISFFPTLFFIEISYCNTHLHWVFVLSFLNASFQLLVCCPLAFMALNSFSLSSDPY